MKSESKKTTAFTWEYSPAPESTAHIKLAPRYELFINGNFVKPQSKKYFDTYNPATEEKLSEVALANEKDVDLAVKAARSAYEKVWKKMPAQERAKYIFRISRMIQERSRELAIIESMDGGKPIRESRDFDIPTAALCLVPKSFDISVLFASGNIQAAATILLLFIITAPS